MALFTPTERARYKLPPMNRQCPILVGFNVYIDPAVKGSRVVRVRMCYNEGYRDCLHDCSTREWLEHDSQLASTLTVVDYVLST